MEHIDLILVLSEVSIAMLLFGYANKKRDEEFSFRASIVILSSLAINVAILLSPQLFEVGFSLVSLMLAFSVLDFYTSPKIDSKSNLQDGYLDFSGC